MRRAGGSANRLGDYRGAYGATFFVPAALRAEMGHMPVALTRSGLRSISTAPPHSIPAGCPRLSIRDAVFR